MVSKNSEEMAGFKLIKEKQQIEFETEKVIALDIEPSDPSVGIFGNWFSIGFETKNDKVWIGLGDNQLDELLNLLQPYYERRRAEEAWEREMEAEWESNSNDNNSLGGKTLCYNCGKFQIFDSSFDEDCTRCSECGCLPYSKEEWEEKQKNGTEEEDIKQIRKGLVFEMLEDKEDD